MKFETKYGLTYMKFETYEKYELGQHLVSILFQRGKCQAYENICYSCSTQDNSKIYSNSLICKSQIDKGRQNCIFYIQFYWAGIFSIQFFKNGVFREVLKFVITVKIVANTFNLLLLSYKNSYDKLELLSSYIYNSSRSNSLLFSSIQVLLIIKISRINQFLSQLFLVGNQLRKYSKPKKQKSWVQHMQLFDGRGIQILNVHELSSIFQIVGYLRDLYIYYVIMVNRVKTLFSGPSLNNFAKIMSFFIELL
eukprot:TRINITY_DN4691_c1_g1_i6.p2 TRINITY_DN4691_c1_g1~~TRINITY_DN4691_c1_g1_i6.p2  ORF type:complete len:251 (-),score=-3.85 TRINITY_DN4691_c1_g1_i6:539-1291(-)